MAHPEIGFAMMKKALGELENMGHPDAPPKLNGKQINVMLTPLPPNKRKPKFHVPESAAAEPKHESAPPPAE
jgi:translation initiation factor IF-3